MVHQTSSDLKNWGALVEDVTYPTYTDRPGMPVVAKVSTRPGILESSTVSRY